MDYKKELNNEELKKVTGGYSEDSLYYVTFKCLKCGKIFCTTPKTGAEVEEYINKGYMDCHYCGGKSVIEKVEFFC